MGASVAQSGGRVKGRPLQPGAARSFRQIARELGCAPATAYRIYRGVFARMDATGIPQPRRRRRRMRASELAAA